MKKVYIAKNPADAHLLKGLLEGENIEAEVRGEFLYGVRGEVPTPSLFSLSARSFPRAPAPDQEAAVILALLRSTKRRILPESQRRKLR